MLLPGYREYIWQNLSRSLKVWKSARSFAVLVICIAGSFVWVFGYQASTQDTLTRVGLSLGNGLAFWFLILVTFVTPARMWVELQRRLQPRLELVFEADKEPFVKAQHFKVHSDRGGGTIDLIFERRYRIGLKNFGSEPAKVQIILERCEPSEIQHLHLGSAFQAYDYPDGTRTAVVFPSGEGGATRFFDVVYERWNLTLSEEGSPFIYLCYCQNIPNWIKYGSYILTLRVVADPEPQKKRFEVKKLTLDEKLTMRELKD